ncbi:MAG: hypothetical protein WD066_03685 [Planctomycetaceae bacterium]
MDVRPTHGAQLGDVSARRRAVFRIESDRRLGELAHVVAVIDDVEPLAIAQPGEHLQRGGLRLLPLLARHAARTVECERHFPPNRFATVRVVRHAGEQQEVAPIAAGRIGIGHQRGGHAALLQQVRQAERAGVGRGGFGDAGRDDAVRRPRRFDRVRRRIDGGDRPLRLDPHGDLPGRAVVERIGAGQDEIDLRAARGEHLLVGDPHFLRAVRRDGEHARANHVGPDEFEQRGVAGLGDDRVVDAAGLVFRQKFGGRLAGRSLEREPADDGAFRHGQHDFRFLHARVRIGEGDVDRRRRDLFGNDDARFHPGHRHGANAVPGERP